MATWSRFDWQPGNGTRYDLIYSSDSNYNMIGWLQYGGSGNVMLFIDFIHYTYLMEKLHVNIADAVGILKFLDYQGHSVGFPSKDVQYEQCHGKPRISRID